MRALVSDIGYLLRTSWSFRLALLYLVSLLILIIVLPIIPLPFSPNDLDLEHIFAKPFTTPMHILGTDQLGRDVVANLLHGARNGLLIALPVMLLATIVGAIVGATAGYFGNYRFRLTIAQVLLAIGFIIIGSYYLCYVPVQALNNGYENQIVLIAIVVGLVLLIVWNVTYLLWKKVTPLRKPVAVPIDSITLRTIELLNSIPRIMLLISVAAFISPSVILLAGIFICTYWTSPARLARAEMLRIIKLPYFEAAVSTGMSHQRIITHEAIPNLLTPVVVSFVFGVASLLTIESTLSFLGIGLPATFASWGRMIAGIRSNLSAWWLVAFPGGFLALTVLALQTCSYQLLRLYQQKNQ